MYGNYIVTSSNNEENVEEFSKQLLDSYNKTCPNRSECMAGAKHESPWTTDEIRNLVKFKHFLYKNSKRASYVSLFVYNRFKSKLIEIIKK